MRRTTFIALAAAACFFAAPAFAAPDQAPAADAAAEKARVPLKIPAADRQRKNPHPASEASLERGQRLFSAQCAMCHGANGNGSSELARRLGFDMPDLTNREQQKSRTDGEMFYVLTRGHGGMPAETRVTEEWRWDLVNYVRTFAE